MDNPIIIFSNEDILKIVSMWLNGDFEYIYTYLGIIFSELGFNNMDMIDVYGYTENNYLLFRVNNNEEYNIRISNNSEKPEFYFCKGDNEIGYECIFDEYRKYDLKLRRINKEIGVSDAVDKINASREYIDYSFLVGEYIVELRLSKNYYYEKLKNRDILFEYLSNLVFPVSIIDVYNYIVEVCLDKDISKYELIDLRILKWDINMDEYKITDLITMTDGELVYIFITKDGIEISTYNDGIWLYESNELRMELNTYKVDDMVNFDTKIRIKEKDCDDIDLIDRTIDSSREDILKLKRRIKDSFCRR